LHLLLNPKACLRSQLIDDLDFHVDLLTVFDNLLICMLLEELELGSTVLVEVLHEVLPRHVVEFAFCLTDALYCRLIGLILDNILFSKEMTLAYNSQLKQLEVTVVHFRL
jgi:hypothetical protein